MNKRGLISLVSLVLTVGFILCVAASTVAKAANQTSFDSDFLVSRAIVLGNFTSDEISPIPEIRYLMPGEEGASEMQFNHSRRIVNIFDPRFGLGGIQAIFTAPVYKVQDGEQALTFSSFKKTVGDILAENGVVLANEDQVTPAVSESPLTNSIKITRVSVAQIDEFQTLPYQTKTIDDPTLERGKQIIQQAGKNGKKKITYEVRRENGVEISKTLVSQTVEEEPQTKIIKNGTKVVVLSSVRGIATATNLSNAVVSANYRRGTLLRITNVSNGVSIIKTVNYTWGTASAPSGVVLDLSWSILDELNFNGNGAGPSVLVEELKQ